MASSNKLEGTTQTYGQLVIFGQQYQSSTSSQTTQSVQGSVNQSQTPSTANRENTAAQASLTNHPTLPASDPVAVAVSAPLMSTTQENFISPQDTLVKVVSNTTTKAVGLGCAQKATISMAAMSTNKNATVAVDQGSLVQTLPKTLQGSVLNSISSVVPNVVDYAKVVGSTVKSKDEIRQALTEGQKVDLSITLRSKRSESIEFNTLKKPRLEVDFLYNFFVEDEEDISKQEDQTKDPLLKNRPVDTPRYANLAWTVAQVTEPLAGTEEEVKKGEKLRRKSFARPRGRFSLGSQNVPFSMQSNKKNANPFVKDGLEREVVDIHQPEKAFSALANDDEFPNSVSVTLNVSTQNKVISELPISNIKK